MGKSQDVSPCGTPDRDSAEYVALLQLVSSNQNISAGTTQWEIPIWLYVVRDDAGNFPFQSTLTPMALIEGVNEHFLNTDSPDKLHFYLCGITYIDESDWTTLNLYQNELPALQAYASSNNSQYDNGFVSVFFVSTIWDAVNHQTLGFAGFPNQGNFSSVEIANLDPGNLAHELGHYFGLIHTHSGGPSNQ